MAKRLSEQALRASWEAERDEIRKHMLSREVPFNPKNIDKFIKNFIDSMVFAGLACKSEDGVKASFAVFYRERMGERQDLRLLCLALGIELRDVKT